MMPFKIRVDKSLSLSKFLLKRLSHNLDLNSIDDRAKFIDKSKTYVAQLPKGQFGQLLMEKISQITKTKVNFTIENKSVKVKGIDQWNPVRKAIVILMNKPGLVSVFPDSLTFSELKLNGIDILMKIVDFCRLNPYISTAALVENFRQHQAYSHLSSLMTVSLGLNNEQLQLELKDIKKYFEKSVQKNKIDSLREKQAHSSLTATEKKQLVNLLNGQVE